MEDPDSLRFTLSILDYDLTQNRPHFPAYPVYCFIVKIFFALFGNLSVAFAVVGGISTFLIVYYGSQIITYFTNSQIGFFAGLLLFFTPLLTILSNRHMPDSLGLAVVVTIIHFFIQWHKTNPFTPAALIIALSGLLSGIRLSYIPFIAPITLIVIWHHRKHFNIWLIGITSGLIWLIPLIIDTGWSALLKLGQSNTHGHFNEWGGTILTHNYPLQRIQTMAQHVFVDGVGGYASGRHWITMILSFLCLIFFALGVKELIQSKHKKVILLLLTCIFTYLIWVFLFQNVLYKSRHMAPILFSTIIILCFGIYSLRKISKLSYLLAGLLLIFCAIVSTVLSKQHMQPTAMAQASHYIKSHKSDKLIAPELIGWYMQRQMKNPPQVVLPEQYENDVQTGSIISFYPIKRACSDTITFYHNPLVNRMWPSVTLYLYE